VPLQSPAPWSAPARFDSGRGLQSSALVWELVALDAQEAD